MAIAWLTVAVSITGIIAIPALVMVIRMAMRWKGIEDKQEQLVKDVAALLQSTDKRLRWLEENIWSHGRRRRSLPTCYEDVSFLLPNLTTWLIC